MAKRQKPTEPRDATETPPALQTKSAQDAQTLMASVVQIKPEWHEAAQDISQAYLAERTEGHYGSRAYLANADAIASILAAIDGGLSPQQGAVSIGIQGTTITNYIQDAEKEAKQGLYTARVRFAQACQKASERRRMRLLGRIEAAGMAGPQFWTAPAWLLERGYGNDYKLQQDRVGAQVIVNVGILTATDVQIGVSDTQITPVDVPHNALPDIDITPKS